jgi:hypothetical protein
MSYQLWEFLHTPDRKMISQKSKSKLVMYGEHLVYLAAWVKTQAFFRSISHLAPFSKSLEINFLSVNLNAFQWVKTVVSWASGFVSTDSSS